MGATDLGPKRLPPGRHGLSREQVALSQRDRIHAAIISLVSEQGYLATSVDDVTRLAGVSKASFYKHFDNREQCLWSANDERFADLAMAIDDAYRTGGKTWKQRIRAGLVALLAHMAAKRDFTQVLLGEGLAAGRSGLVRRQLVLEALQTYFDPELRPELASMKIEQPALRATATVDALAGMLQSYVDDRRITELPAHVGDFVWLALLAYGGEDEPVAA